MSDESATFQGSIWDMDSDGGSKVKDKTCEDCKWHTRCPYEKKYKPKEVCEEFDFR